MKAKQVDKGKAHNKQEYPAILWQWLWYDIL